jgi:hypothetical protein
MPRGERLMIENIKAVAGFSYDRAWTNGRDLGANGRHFSRACLKDGVAREGLIDNRLLAGGFGSGRMRALCHPRFFRPLAGATFPHVSRHISRWHGLSRLTSLTRSR